MDNDTNNGQGQNTQEVNAETGFTQYISTAWQSLLLTGIALLIMGIIVLGAQSIFSILSVLFLGWALLIAGVIDVIQSFFSGSLIRFFLSFVAGIFLFLVGFFILVNPVSGTIAFALLISLAFVTTGIFQAITSLFGRFTNWQWPLISGIVSILIGVAIWQRWPDSSLQIIGLMVGLGLAVGGFATIMVSLGVRSDAKQQVERATKQYGGAMAHHS